ncbi:MAG: PD40 domain-containing protein, partial [Saprospiraceae bacterium]|nr:PD40 domain-containing protein [Saprospiraceae bacterium]
MKKQIFIALSFAIVALSCHSGKKAGAEKATTYNPAADSLRLPQEKHLRNVRQLTFGGDNAEAYWSFDGKSLSFQATNEKWGASCDQIFTMDIEGGTHGGQKPQQISSGTGKTTCSYFLPGNKSVLFASTHGEESGHGCPNAPRSVDGKYVWAIHQEFDIYVADLNGKIQKQLTNTPGYDAEATVSPDGKKIVFTSTRSGDLELWTMNIDGTDQRQVTKGLGYDGGAFFSPDSKKLVFRASRPKTEEEQKVYKELLAKGLVQPTALEIFTCNVDGSDLRQITNVGKANWAPFMHPSGKKIL